MYRESSHIDDDAPVPITDIDPVIDFANDQVDIRNDVDGDQPDEDPIADEPERWIENAELDNVLDEFVDRVNGRDLDGLSDLLATDAEFPRRALGRGSGQRLQRPALEIPQGLTKEHP